MRKLIFVVVLLAFAGIARAQTWPSRQITLIVPFPPGGSTDVVARIMAERMRPLLGQPVIIENVGGAGGSIGVGRVARAAPDGYTIDIGQWDTHVGSVIYSLNYDLQRDFAPIGLLSINPQLMVGKKSLPANDLRSLVAWMKANPGKATLVNQLASAQLTGQLLQQLTGTSLQLIPYRGAGPAMTDLLAEQVDLMVSRKPLSCCRICKLEPSNQLQTSRRVAPLLCLKFHPRMRAACQDSTPPDGLDFLHRKAPRRTLSPS
jgi:tripartite-type tricarboxylate transporter receptor subunit TctC